MKNPGNGRDFSMRNTIPVQRRAPNRALQPFLTQIEPLL